MDKSALLVLHHYNNHANALLLKTAADLDITAFSSPSSPSHGSVQGELTHMVMVEFFFLARAEGKPVNPKDTPDEALTLEEIKLTFAQIADDRKRYLDWVTEEKLAEEITLPIRGKSFMLARWQCLAQALLHSAHHRGELSIVMTVLGHPLPTLDAIIQFVKESGQEWPWD
ncbi:MAG: hypothetical protein C0401_01850 [Anaerolinea sp.]|nr:hypothetical protein [Anaerolinea sp.]